MQILMSLYSITEWGYVIIRYVNALSSYPTHQPWSSQILNLNKCSGICKEPADAPPYIEDEFNEIPNALVP